MSLPPGTRLGSYEITAQIGAGGMGEVYRARDTRLDRDVAIKVLPESVAADADRIARFEREAKTLAALNHPNIAQIHGLEESDGVKALVMELVEGPTLANRIAQGPIPVDEALPIARQIAEALEAAHEQGIIHRDLKPANIKVRPDGTVKVLDFGLAKAMEPAGAALSPGLSQSPTITTPAMTQAGMILGTAAYMSPEQARGRPVDRRADIWAFGCVLYEMLTGRKPFDADDVSLTLARVLERDVDWHALPAGLSPGLRAQLHRSLQKDPRRRLQAIGDFRLALEGEFDASLPTAATTTPSARLPRVILPAVATVALAFGLLGGAALGPLRAPPPDSGVVRLSIPLPAGEEVAPNDPALALSRDGSMLAYASQGGAVARLSLRSFGESAPRALPGTEGARNPFFSPDGQWVGFFTEGQLKKVSVASGAVEVIGDAVIARGGSWAEDDTIYFAPRNNSSIWRVSASGGAPAEVTSLSQESGEVSHRWPQVLPGGQVLLFTAWTGPGTDERSVQAQSLVTGERILLARAADTGRYVASGHLVYARGDTLMAAPMDVGRLTVGDARTVQLPEVVWTGGEGSQFAVSDAGRLVLLPGDPRRREAELVRIDRNGGITPLPMSADDYHNPRLSPDGAKLAVEVRRSAIELWVYDFARSTFTRVTTAAEGSSQAPAWTADGTHVLYRATRAGTRNLWRKSVESGGSEERLTLDRSATQTPQSVSPDGRVILFSQLGQGSAGSMIAMLGEDGDVAPWLDTPGDEGSAQISPDGGWVAYRSNASGLNQVYVSPFTEPSAARQVSINGGAEPVWSRDGRELFYLAGDDLMAVDVQTRPAFSAGLPRVVHSGRYARSQTGTFSYDVSRDGQWFIRIRSTAPTPARFDVVLNFFSELERLAPAD